MTEEEARSVLARCREEIDGIDQGIVELLNRRTEIVERIGVVKRSAALPVYEPKREDEVYANIAQANTGPLPQDSARRIFERIIDEMRTLQRNRQLETTKGGTAC